MKKFIKFIESLKILEEGKTYEMWETCIVVPVIDWLMFKEEFKKIAEVKKKCY